MDTTDYKDYKESSDSRPYYALLQQYNIDDSISSVIDTLVDAGYLEASQIDHELLTCIGEYPTEVGKLAFFSYTIYDILVHINIIGFLFCFSCQCSASLWFRHLYWNCK